MARLPTPRLRIWRTEDDTEPLEVQVINPDLLLMETTARKHHWGPISESGLKQTTFMAWAALRRKKLLEPADQTYEEFEATTAAVVAVDGPAEAASPTQPDPESG